jgi:hypothetical protein
MIKPDEALFHAHMKEAAFQSGADRGKWGFAESDPPAEWPYQLVWIESDKQFVSSGRITLRFTLDEYPAKPPSAVPWDLQKQHVLPPNEWPKGEGNVSKVFNPGWNSTALYAPCDRVAMVGHDAWKTALACWWWTNEKTIVLYLEFVHRCLNPEHDAA